MNKKIMWTLLVFLSFLGNIKAITFKGGDVIDNVFILKVKENGEKEYKKGQFIVDEYNNYVYCLEPFVKVKTSSTYDIHEDNFEKVLGMSDELWKKINLIIYYGYEYKDLKHDHNASMWYYITQMLIWEAVSPNSNFYFTDTFNGNINTSLFQKEKEEIMYLVNTHEEIPKFTYPEIYIGDTIEITDTKDILYRFNRIVGAEKKQENKLIIKLTEKNNIIAVRKMNKSKAYLFTSSDSQNILKGREDFPVSVSYNIKAKEVLGNIKIKKYGEIYTNNSYTKDVLQNIEFSLYDSNKFFLKKALTNNDGEIIFSNLKKGTYYIKETNTLNDYILDENYYKVTLSLNSNNRIDDIFLEFDNILKKGNILITKKDKDTNLPIKDTKFVIMKDEKNIFEGYTNELGIIEIKNLPLGTYTIKEVETAYGYILNEEIYEVTIYDNNITKLVEVKNELQKGNLVIKKIDIDTNLPIKDIKFIIMNDNNVIYEGYTNKEGIFEVNNLPLGTYFIKEVEAPDCYVKNEINYEVSLLEHQKTEVIVIKNELKKGKLIIKKVDADYRNPLSNTEFIILKDEKIVYKGKTNKDGILEIDNLILGSYIIKEVKASDGYIINEEEINIIIEDKENYILISNKLLEDKEYVEIPNIPNTNVSRVEILLYFEDKNKMHKRDL